jgi:hypothetical protein
MAVNPLQWNPIRANFGDATGMMQSAGQSIGRATDTVGNIFKQAQEAERQKLAQEQMLAQRAMEQERLGIAKAREDREAETYRIESEGSVLGNNFYEEYNNIRQDKPELTPQEYIAGINVEGVDPRSLDIGLNNFMKKAKEDQDLVNTSFDTAKKRREAETYRAIKDSDINYYAPEEEIIAKANKLPTEARDEVIKTYQAIQKNKLELENLERKKNSHVSKEQIDSIALAYYNPNTKPEERIDILTSAMLLHRDDTEATGVFSRMLSAELQKQGLEASRAKELSKSFKASTKDLDKDIQNAQKGGSYFEKEYKDYNIHRDGVAQLDNISRALYDPKTKVGIGADQLIGVLSATGNLNKRWVPWGYTMHNKDADMEVTGVDDLIIDNNGTPIINKDMALGKTLINLLKNNAITKGIDPDSLAIIRNTDNYYKEPSTNKVTAPIKYPTDYSTVQEGTANNLVIDAFNQGR